jgi:hypothetical protein
MVSDAIDIYERLRVEIERRLVQANRRSCPGPPYKPRPLRLGDVVACLRDVVEGQPLSLRDGGRARARGTVSAMTTFTLTARVEGRIYLGISATWAWRPDPAWSFPELPPLWANNPIKTRSLPLPPSDSPEKWAAWACSPDVLALDDPEIDAILECFEDTITSLEIHP